MRPAAPPPHTSRDFVPWRFLDAGRKSAWKGSSCRRPKTCTTTDIGVSIAGKSLLFTFASGFAFPFL
jgi:hypothetical protein